MNIKKSFIAIAVSIAVLSTVSCSTTSEVREISGKEVQRNSFSENEKTDTENESQSEKVDRELAKTNVIDLFYLNHALLKENRFNEACELYSYEYIEFMAEKFNEAQLASNCSEFLRKVFVDRMEEPNRIISEYGTKALTIPEFYIPSEIKILEDKISDYSVSAVTVKKSMLESLDPAEFSVDNSEVKSGQLSEWFNQSITFIKNDEGNWVFSIYEAKL